MPLRARRDVLFADVHGVVLSAATLDRPMVPLVGQQLLQKWANAVREVLDQNGALALQVKEALLKPRALWELRMKLTFTTPRTKKGRVIRERKFHERVNLRLLRTIAPSFMKSLEWKCQRRIVRQVRKLRQDTARYGYFLEPKMRRLIREFAGQWMLYLTTAGRASEVEEEFRSERVVWNLFVRVFLTEKVGLPKSHPDFWFKIAKLVNADPKRCVAIEDNLVMGWNALRAGMSVVLYDRGYGLEEFIRDELKGEVAGVTLSRAGDALPAYGKQFVVCAKTPAGIKQCLQMAALQDSS